MHRLQLLASDAMVAQSHCDAMESNGDLYQIWKFCSLAGRSIREPSLRAYGNYFCRLLAGRSIREPSLLEAASRILYRRRAGIDYRYAASKNYKQHSNSIHRFAIPVRAIVDPLAVHSSARAVDQYTCVRFAIPVEATRVLVISVHSLARAVDTRQDKKIQDKTRQDKTLQDKIRQNTS